MPAPLSLNQIEPSDLTTTSFGPVSFLPSKLSASTVTVPSYSVRVSRCASISQVTSPALAVAGIAIGVARGLAEQADCARLLLPFHDPVVRDVAPQETAEITEPNRPFG